MARHFRGTGLILRFIEYMDVGATNGWRMDDVVPSAEIVARIDASCRSSRSIRTTAAKSPSAGATATAAARSASSPRSRRRSAATARARACRPTASSTPACSPTSGSRPARAVARRRRRRRDRHAIAAIWRSAPTAIRRSARADTARAAENRDVLHRRLKRQAPTRTTHAPPRRYRISAGVGANTLPVVRVEQAGLRRAARGIPGAGRGRRGAGGEIRPRAIPKRRCSASSRPMRFSKDRTPYKTHFSAALNDRANRPGEPVPRQSLDHEPGVFRPSASASPHHKGIPRASQTSWQEPWWSGWACVRVAERMPTHPAEDAGPRGACRHPRSRPPSNRR